MQTDTAYRCTSTTPTEEELDRLWAEYRRTRDDGPRNRLIEHYLPLVKRQADRLCARLPAAVDPDDVYEAGILGLYRAIQSFEPGRGVKFETYGAARIRGAILDALRRNDWVPRSVRRRHRLLERLRQRLEAELGRPPTDAEMAERLGMTPEQYEAFARDGQPTQVASLDNFVSAAGGEGHDATWLHLMAQARAEDPERRALARDLRDLLTRHLSRNERLVLILYYYEQMTMKEIAAALGLSETRICQIHASVLERLRERLAHRREELLAS